MVCQDLISDMAPASVCPERGQTIAAAGAVSGPWSSNSGPMSSFKRKGELAIIASGELLNGAMCRVLEAAACFGVACWPYVYPTPLSRYRSERSTNGCIREASLFMGLNFDTGPPADSIDSELRS